MYNPIIHQFYPCKTEGGPLRQEPLKNILLGEVIADPFHPDPAIQAFLRYVPSLILQVLAVDLTEDEWNDLTQASVEAGCYQAFKARLSERLAEKEEFFTLHADQNGFYQNHDVKDQVLNGEKGAKRIKGSAEGLDGLLLHFTSGNNHTHFKRPGLLQKICPPCALISLMHHDYFCVAGLAGPANLRGNQAYLCMIGEAQDNSFKRMIRNTFFPKHHEDMTASLGWDKNSETDQPSWLKPGRKQGNEFEVSITEAGLARAMLNTPRHAFFEIEETRGGCDLCGLETDQLVRRYYWRKDGDKFSSFIGHPTLATYEENGKTLPQNYNPSVWHSLGPLALKTYKSISNKSISKRNFKAAPLVEQFSYFREETEEREFQLELQAYQTDKAKLLGFHYQTIKLPVFKKDEENEQYEFYREIEHFTVAIKAMLQAFQSCGKADKKRSKVQVPNIENKHNEFVQHWGEWVLNNFCGFPRQSEQRLQHFVAQLEAWRRELIDAFDRLCDSFAWDDVSSQRKLCKQKNNLRHFLNKTLKTYQEKEDITP